MWKFRLDFARYYVLSFPLLFSGLTFSGCSWFQSPVYSNLPIEERPLVAVLPFGFDIEIQHLSTIKDVEEPLSETEEAQQLETAVQTLRQEARWLFESRLATRHGFLFVSEELVDQAMLRVGLEANSPPTTKQLAALRHLLEVDLVIVGDILDFGKVRWQWLVAGALADVTVETIIVGLATSWNPPALLANAGIEALTNSAIFLGGGYLFGIAFRPVRVAAQAYETATGEQVWENTEVSIYLWGELKRLPEEMRAKKEVQLFINLSRAIEELANSLAGEGLTLKELGKLRRVSSEKL